MNSSAMGDSLALTFGLKSNRKASLSKGNRMSSSTLLEEAQFAVENINLVACNEADDQGVTISAGPALQCREPLEVQLVKEESSVFSQLDNTNKREGSDKVVCILPSLEFVVSLHVLALLRSMVDQIFSAMDLLTAKGTEVGFVYLVVRCIDLTSRMISIAQEDLSVIPTPNWNSLVKIYETRKISTENVANHDSEAEAAVSRSRSSRREKTEISDVTHSFELKANNAVSILLADEGVDSKALAGAFLSGRQTSIGDSGQIVGLMKLEIKVMLAKSLYLPTEESHNYLFHLGATCYDPMEERWNDLFSNVPVKCVVEKRLPVASEDSRGIKRLTSSQSLRRGTVSPPPPPPPPPPPSSSSSQESKLPLPTGKLVESSSCTLLWAGMVSGSTSKVYVSRAVPPASMLVASKKRIKRLGDLISTSNIPSDSHVMGVLVDTEVFDPNHVLFVTPRDFERVGRLNQANSTVGTPAYSIWKPVVRFCL